MALLRSLPQDLKVDETEYIETFCERILGSYDLAGGRNDAALAHMRRAVSAMEEAARAHPDFVSYQEEVGSALVGLAMTELRLGDVQGALRTARRIRELVEPVLREHPDLRYAWNWKVVSLLIEAYVYIGGGHANEAAQAADRAADGFRVLTPPLTGQEHFFRGVIEALFFAVGRPGAADRPAELPGLRKRFDGAIADAVEADRLGFRDPVSMTVLSQLIGHPPSMRLLIMDQTFPIEPFQLEPDAEDHGLAADLRAEKP